MRITAPTVTSSTNSLANNATQLIIKGANFDAVTAGNNIVQFTTLNVTGTVSAVNAAGTQLTVTINTLPSGNGPLMAIVSFGTNPTINSGAAVQVATVVDPPKVFGSTQDMAINAPTLVITGSGFSTTPANNTLVFDQGAFGTVTAVNGAGTQLTVSFVPPPAANKAPTTLGPMTVIVTANGSNSGPATQVANIVSMPVVNAVTDDMASNWPTLIIQGSNFSTTPSKNTVVFTSGAVGTVTAVNPGGTQLTVSFVPPPATNKAPTSLGAMKAVVTSNNGASRRFPRRPGSQRGQEAHSEREHAGTVDHGDDPHDHGIGLLDDPGQEHRGIYCGCGWHCDSGKTRRDTTDRVVHAGFPIARPPPWAS